LLFAELAVLAVILDAVEFLFCNVRCQERAWENAKPQQLHGQ
jgi:hypothetical protein